MALTTPILPIRVIPFDKSNNNVFTFEVIGGSQVVANTLEIQKNSDSSQVYIQKQDTFKFEHLLASDLLSNGIQYRYRIKTHDVENNESQWSDWGLLWCFTTPSLNVDIGGGVINNSSWSFISSYSQLENEELESYQFYLYNLNSALIAASTTKYYQVGDEISHQFSGLKDNTQYKVELKITTLHGMEATSGLLTFSVNYIEPQIPFILLLENLSEQGKIKATTNVINIIGTSSTDPLSYIDNDWVDLSDGNTWVQFDEGFSCDENFTLKLWCKGLINNTVFLELLSNNHTEQSPCKISLKYLNNKIYVNKIVDSQIYNIYSDEILPTVDDTVFVWLQGKDHLLDIKTQVT